MNGAGFYAVGRQFYHPVVKRCSALILVRFRDERVQRQTKTNKACPILSNPVQSCPASLCPKSPFSFFLGGLRAHARFFPFLCFLLFLYGGYISFFFLFWFFSLFSFFGGAFFVLFFSFPFLKSDSI